MSKLLTYGLASYLIGILIAVLAAIDAVKYAASQVPVNPYAGIATTGVNWTFIIFFMIVVLISAGVILLFKDKIKKQNIFGIASYIYVFLGAFIATWFITVFFSQNLTVDLIISIIVAIEICIIYKEDKLKYFNAFAILISVVGIYALSNLGIATMAVLMVIMAIYDYIAVFKTKHMQEMAKTLITSSLPPVVLIEGKPEDILAKLNNPKKKPSKNMGKTRALGLGDIILPGGLIAAIAISQYSVYAIPLAFAATAGIAVSIWLSGRLKHAIPAIPVIGATILLGYIVMVIL